MMDPQTTACKGTLPGYHQIRGLDVAVDDSRRMGLNQPLAARGESPHSQVNGRVLVPPGHGIVAR